MRLKWARTEKNTCSHWQAESNGVILVVEKTPGYDPVYGAFAGGQELHNAMIWGGTVAGCKKAAEKLLTGSQPLLAT
jgi:hypothetical protein